jgi:hypothetical protein
MRCRKKRIIINSGATSHFISEELELPTDGTSQKTIYLPNRDTLQSINKTSLPFDQLMLKARQADVIPQLQQSLLSIHKMAEERYTTIFHPGNQGVTIHEPNTVKITTSKPLIIQGSKEKGQKLWTIPIDKGKEQINNVYNLPSTKQGIQYLHAAAGFPVQETWIQAIKAGN